MEALALLATLVTIAVTVWIVARRLRARRRDIGLDADERDELEAIAQRLLAEQHAERSGRLSLVLEKLRARRVPLVRVRGGRGVRGQAYLEFADGTTVLARAHPVGDLVSLAMAALNRRVLLAGWQDSGRDIMARLVWLDGDLVVSVVSVEAEPLSS